MRRKVVGVVIEEDINWDKVADLRKRIDMLDGVDTTQTMGEDVYVADDDIIKIDHENDSEIAKMKIFLEEIAQKLYDLEEDSFLCPVGVLRCEINAFLDVDSSKRAKEHSFSHLFRSREYIYSDHQSRRKAEDKDEDEEEEKDEDRHLTMGDVTDVCVELESPNGFLDRSLPENVSFVIKGIRGVLGARPAKRGSKVIPPADVPADYELDDIPF